MHYICGFCNTKHDNAADYAHCVASCAKKESDKAKIAEAQEREKKAKERREKIKSLYDELLALTKEEYAEGDEDTSVFKVVFPKIDAKILADAIADLQFSNWPFN